MAEPEVKPRRTGARAHEQLTTMFFSLLPLTAVLISLTDEYHSTDECHRFVPNPVLEIESTLRKRLHLKSLWFNRDKRPAQELNKVCSIFREV